MATPTDPLFAQQWHLSMLGNIRKIWDEFTGAGVRVAVYDDGVQRSHADLAANYDASRHFTHDGITFDPRPLGPNAGHGTSCAGLIAAVDNNGRGGVGVAHGARITGLNYLSDLQYEYDWDSQTTSPLYDAAMRWAAGFDIMSNSWGTNPDFSDELSLNIAGNSSAVDAAHFDWISANGRGGLGTVVVKAAGNETLNANGDGANVSRHTITVAATTQNGFAADYSNFGSSILVTAPAAAVTTDLTGSQGYDEGDYTSSFGGTSAATPVVSGVAALMLDANAGLGWRDVQAILALSASHTGSALGAGPAATEVGKWLTMGGEHWNGGGEIYHLSYGFGMVDAFAATRMAEVWTRLYGTAHKSANEAHVTAEMDGFSVAIKDSDANTATAEAAISFVVTQDIEIESVQVSTDLLHGRGTDLVLMLVSPDGHKVTLSERELPNGGLAWTFAAEAFRGMSSKGSWTVEVHDRVAGIGGRIYDAQLEFYGAANTANDVYHFTDDFRMLRGIETGRQVIDDVNGGIDWLNFVAITGNLSISMAAGGAVKVNGISLARLATGATDFERLQAGDGADVLYGNALANRILGGRGNDLIKGGYGNDYLFGEQGADTLSGGSGADSFEFRRGAGADRITDWQDNLDTLRLDDTIWGGGKSVGQMLASFGSIVSGAAVLSFAGGLSVTVEGVTSLRALLDDVLIV